MPSTTDSSRLSHRRGTDKIAPCGHPSRRRDARLTSRESRDHEMHKKAGGYGLTNPAIPGNSKRGRAATVKKKLLPFLPMDVTRTFFNKLRTLAVTLEKQTEQFKQVFHEDDTEFDDDTPMRYLHELYTEVRTLKRDADNILQKSSSERDATCDFIMAIKVLMKRNATNLGNITHFFQEYGYKAVIDKNAAVKEDAEISPASTVSDQAEPQNLDCPGKSFGSHSPLQIPQLSDYGLSKYALPSSSDTICFSHVPKEKLKEDESPKVENFHIHGCDLYVNDETTNLMEDQTIFLLNAKKHRKLASDSAVALASNKNEATPKKPNETCDYDCMASPAAPKFCTPGLKIPQRKNGVLSETPESSCMGDPKYTTKIPFPNMKPLQMQPTHAGATNILPDTDPVNTVAPALQSDKHLQLFSPAVQEYNLLNSPLPPPEITVIPKQILQILSKYNPNREGPKSPEKGTK